MKTRWALLALVLVTSPGSAEAVLARIQNVHVLARVASPEDADKLAQAALDLDGFTKSDLGRLVVSRAGITPTSFGCDTKVVVRFFDVAGSPISMRAAEVKHVTVVVAGKPVGKFEPSDNAIDESFFIIELKPSLGGSPVKEICDTRNGQRVILTAYKSDAEFESFFLARRRHVDAYGFDFTGTNTIGLWAPVGLVATNFERTEDGMEFATLPVGGAVGLKWWLSDRFYLGGSAIGMYAATASKQPAAGTPTDPADDQARFTLKAFGLGGLLDINSVAYVSYSYQYNLQKGQKDAGWMLGVGFGAGLLDAIARGAFGGR